MLQFVKLTLISATFLLSSLSLAKSENLQKIDDLIAGNKLVEAKALITEQIETSEEAPLLLVRKSRIISLEADATADEKTKVALFEEAKGIADKLTKDHPEVAGGHLRKAISAGKLALYKGILQSRSLLLEVKASASKVFDLKEKSTYEEALANYILGRAHMKVAEKPKAIRLPLGLGWASKKKGADHLKKAYSLSPNSVPISLDHAKVLVDAGEKDTAKTILTGIADLKDNDPGDKALKAEAANLLSTL